MAPNIQDRPNDDENDGENLGEDLHPVDRIKAKMFQMLCMHDSEIALQMEDGIPDHQRLLMRINPHEETFDCILRVGVYLSKKNTVFREQSYGHLIRRVSDIAELNNATVMGLLAILTQDERDLLAEAQREHSEDDVFEYVEREQRWDMREHVRNEVRLICERMQYPTGLPSDGE